jgi:hypothetical protein
VANGKNEAFIANPLTFIQNNPVDITLFDASVSGRPRFMELLDEDVWFSMFKALCGTLRQVAFDLVPRSHGSLFSKRNFCVLRFDRSNFDQNFINSINEHRTLKSMETLQVLDAAFRGRGDNPDAPAYQRWVNAKKAMDTFQHRYTSRLDKFVASDTPIQGYFFPYLSPPGGPQQVNNHQWGVRNMGWVDVPRQNPAHDFVFTGMMNGCALVFTDSPLGNTHFRVYHYPNVSTYPRFKTQLRWEGQRRLKVWTVEEYGAVGHPDAFNFLHFHNNEWYLYCQPQTTNRVEGGVVMSIRQKTVRGTALPGRIRVSALQNQFPLNYL